MSLIQELFCASFAGTGHLAGKFINLEQVVLQYLNGSK